MDDPCRLRFERIYDETYRFVLAYARRRASDEVEAADVVSETYLTAWRRLPEVPEGDAARLWLLAVARRVLANQRRSEQRRHSLVLALAEEAATRRGPEASTPDPEEWLRVARAFTGLSAADRELLTLIGWEGLRRDQVAVVLGVNRAVVRVRLHRARARFAIALRAEGVDLKRLPAAGHLSERMGDASADLGVT